MCASASSAVCFSHLAPHWNHVWRSVQQGLSSYCFNKAHSGLSAISEGRGVEIARNDVCAVFLCGFPELAQELLGNVTRCVTEAGHEASHFRKGVRRKPSSSCNGGLNCWHTWKRIFSVLYTERCPSSSHSSGASAVSCIFQGFARIGHSTRLTLLIHVTACERSATSVWLRLQPFRTCAILLRVLCAWKNGAGIHAVFFVTAELVLRSTAFLLPKPKRRFSVLPTCRATARVTGNEPPTWRLFTDGGFKRQADGADLAGW